MQFDDLPSELILNIFSHLPQRHLATVALVSNRCRQLAYDPSLWIEVCFDSRRDASLQRVKEVLDRATMIRKLDVSTGMVDLYTIAMACSRFNMIDELCLPTSALSHHSVRYILKKCSSLSTISLSGSYFLVPIDVCNLHYVPSLKNFIATDGYQIHDNILQQITVSCPNIEKLELNSEYIVKRDTWECLERLGRLRLLSVSKLSTAALFNASKSCPILESLELDTICNENGVSVAQSLQGFTKLKSLSVKGNCGYGWFKAEFRVPPFLEHLDVPELKLQEVHLMRLISTCKNTLRHMTAQVLVDSAVKDLPSCRNLEVISVYDVSGDVPIPELIFKFPRLTRVQLNTVGKANETIRQLSSIVDILDRSERGHTRLVINMFCSSQAMQNALLGEVYTFKEYLAENTAMSRDHIGALEQQWWSLKDECLYRLPSGAEVLQTIVTSFPVIGKTLTHLTLNVMDN